MEDFDFYCAICGSSLVNDLLIGSSSSVSRQRRFERIQRKRRELETHTAAAAGTAATAESTASDYWEECSYDPELVSEESLEWLGHFHCLGFNRDADGVDKCFISGPGINDSTKMGVVDVEKGSDANQPDEPELKCYDYFEDEERGVFPFHWCCFEILTRALTGSTDIDGVDKDILYNTMAELSPDGSNILELDYGITGQDQRWVSVPGEEYSVTHPIVIPGFDNILRNILAEDTFKVPPTDTLNLQQKWVQDPFNKLPFDILHHLFTFLPGKSLQSLMKASWPIHRATRHNEFWKQLLDRDTPWFWELHELIKEPQFKGLNHKSLYLCLDKMTTPIYGMDGPFIGIANRRRIWGICQELAKIYFNRLYQKVGMETSEQAKAIFKHSHTLYMPMVLNPQPKHDVPTVRKQWIYSWHEMDHQVSTFETFWNIDRCLVGLGILFGTSRRIFGRTDTDALRGERIKRRAAHIPAGEWIKGLTLNIPDIDLTDSSAHMAITGMDIILKSGKVINLSSGVGNRRPFVVSEGRCLVGLSGQIGNGLISRLGILECPRPPYDDFSVYTNLGHPEIPEVPFSHRFLWGTHTPIWANNSVKVMPHVAVNPPSHIHVPIDMAPQRVLFWVNDNKEIHKVRRISARVASTEIKERRPNGNATKSSVDEVLGLGVEYVQDYWEPKRYIGTKKGFSNRKREREDLGWPEKQMRHFEIDGPGGEYVTQIEVTADDLPKSIALRTNWGREGYFGSKKGPICEVQHPPEGEVFVGLAASFCAKTLICQELKECIDAGLCQGSKSCTQLKMSSVTGLTKKMNLE